MRNRIVNARCRHWGDGHRLHHIRARLTGDSPWGWRDAVVSGVDGEWLMLQYVHDDGAPRVWHHAPLDLEPGTPVRLHERFRVLGSPSGWVTVVVEGGLGPVPEPSSTDAWERERSAGIVNLETGCGLPTDHRTEN